MAETNSATISANAKKRLRSQVARKRRTAVTKRHARLRKKVQGTPQRPRLAVKRSSRHIVVQLIDDLAGRTLASASSLEADVRAIDGDKKTRASEVGKLVAASARARRASPLWCSTEVVTTTTAGSRRSPTPPARAVWISEWTCKTRKGIV